VIFLSSQRLISGEAALWHIAAIWCQRVDSHTPGSRLKYNPAILQYRIASCHLEILATNPVLQFSSPPPHPSIRSSGRCAEISLQFRETTFSHSGLLMATHGGVGAQQESGGPAC